MGDSPNTLQVKPSPKVSPMKVGENVQRPPKLSPKRSKQIMTKVPVRRSPRKHVTSGQITKSNPTNIELDTSAFNNPATVSVPKNIEIIFPSHPLLYQSSQTKHLTPPFLNSSDPSFSQLCVEPDALNSSPINSPLPSQFHSLDCYEWEDPRPDSPIPYNDLIGDEYEDSDVSDEEYVPESDADIDQDNNYDGGDVEEEVGLESEYQFELLLNKDLEDAIVPELDTSDEECELARERVRGLRKDYSSQLTKCKEKLWRVRVEQKLCSSKKFILNLVRVEKKW